MRRSMLSGLMVMTAIAGGPALGADAAIAVHNGSSVAVEQIVVFHIHTDGSVIDDVVGGRFEPLAPGAQARVPGGPCGPSSIYVRLANGRELSIRLDTCGAPGFAISD